MYCTILRCRVVNKYTYICHTSMLKVDEYRYKDKPPNSRICELCNMYAVENIHHLLMQCPGLHKEQEGMYENLYRNITEIAQKSGDEPRSVFFWLLGRDIPDLCENDLTETRCIASRWICRIYYKTILSRSGIG